MEKRVIKAKKVARDIQRGLNDNDLMMKYQLTPRQLERVLRKLFEADMISDMQLYERIQLSDTQITKAFIETNKAIRELD